MKEIIGYMSDIIDSTDSIIKDKDIKSVIENSIFISVDDSAESKGIYTVTGCMPEVWGAIFHSHFRTMEEQLEQIIENTKISWLDYVLLALTVVGTAKGLKTLYERVVDNIKKLPFIASIFANTTDVHADEPEVDVPEVDIPEVDVPEVDIPEVDVPEVDVPEVDIPEVDIPEVDVPEVDVPEIDVPVGGQVGAPGGESVNIPVNEPVVPIGIPGYLYAAHVGYKMFQNIEGVDLPNLHYPTVISGPKGTGIEVLDSIWDSVSPIIEYTKDSFSTIIQVGESFFNNEIGATEAIVRIGGELLKIWAIINAIIAVICAAVAAYYYFKDSSIFPNLMQSLTQSMQNLIPSMQNLTPSMQSYMPVFQTSNDTVPGIYNGDVANATQYTDSINKEPNIMYTVATNDVTGYTRVAGVNDFTNANNNVYAQHTLKNDNARNDYRELLALNSKSSDIYNTTINNQFDVHVTKEVNPEEVARYVMNEMTRGFKNAHKIRVNEII